MNSLMTGGVTTLVALSVGFGLWYRAEARAQEAAAVAATARAEAAEANVAVLETGVIALQNHLDRTAADRDRWSSVAKALQEKEGHDEVLSPYLRALLDSLRGQGNSGGVPSPADPG